MIGSIGFIQKLDISLNIIIGQWCLKLRMGMLSLLMFMKVINQSYDEKYISTTIIFNNIKQYTDFLMSVHEGILSSIEAINDSNTSPNRLWKSMRKVVKALNQYSSENQNLPPQSLIPCCLFVLPRKLARYLGLQEDQVLQKQPQGLAQNLLTQLYLNSLLKLLKDSAEEISHVIIQGMTRNVPLLTAYPLIAKKWLKCIVGMWCRSHENLNISFRCHLLISKYLTHSSKEMYTWMLRRLYVGYFQNCKQVSWRNYEHINFMTNSYCEIVKIAEGQSYYVLFGYLRSICLQIDKYNKTKGKEKKQILGKLFSYQVLNCFKLFAAILSRISSQQLSALVFPLVELINVYSKLTQSHQYLPLKLHLVEYLMEIMQFNSVYIPAVYDQIIRILSCKVFTQKIKKDSQNISEDITIMYKVSKSDLQNSNIINQLFTSGIRKLFSFMKIVGQSVSGAQILRKISKVLKTFKEEYRYTGYKTQIQKAAKEADKAGLKLYKFRSKMNMSLNNQKLITLFQSKRVKNNQKLSLYQIEKTMRHEEQELLKNKLIAEREENNESKNKQDQDESQEEEQDESGWEEASEGASSFNQQSGELSDGQEEEIQDISYEGDPQNADEADMKWSEHSWSSQNQLDNIVDQKN